MENIFKRLYILNEKRFSNNAADNKTLIYINI